MRSLTIKFNLDDVDKYFGEPDGIVEMRAVVNSLFDGIEKNTMFGENQAQFGTLGEFETTIGSFVINETEDDEE